MTSINTRRSSVTLIRCCRYLPVVVFVVVAVAAAAPRSDHEELARPTVDHSVRHPTAGDHVPGRSQPGGVQRTRQDVRDPQSSSPAGYVHSNATTEEYVHSNATTEEYIHSNATTEEPVSTTVTADSSTTPDPATVTDPIMVTDPTTVTDPTSVTDSTTVSADSSTVSDPFAVLDSTAVPIIAATTESDMSLQIPSPPGRHDTPTAISTTPMPSSVSSAASCRTVFLIHFAAVSAASLLTA
ncbi:soluble scavenger receptor cysteine-rich domain-containing protein SSC5D-like [Sipha flava]|uniref:Soluble scavenger receptor cysteine-rich domain-containing protein SSC5D-like n=1 Tax=Sipha flava TaxID=143950 RepID=A0A8B8GPS5_9HEMI|nr:soluble scavenger receptor cysteine-rich domain-containing protein SSC5D-like [Sipha flava]